MRVVVTEVAVHSIPFSTPDEDRPWDLSSGPDLYIEVHGPDGARLHASEAIDDVRPSDLPVMLEGGFAMEASGRYVLRLLDADMAGTEEVARISVERGALAEAGRGTEPPRCVEYAEGRTTLRLMLAWDETV
jgi:hypothetical protein